MLKRLAPILVLFLTVGVAHAQIGGGHRGGGRGGGSDGSKPSSSSNAPSSKAATPANKLQFVGVVKAIDVPTGRITIAYEPVEAINWPAGTQPFPVAKTAMLTAATVGQKVRFNLDSGEISALAPFDPPPQ